MKTIKDLTDLQNDWSYWRRKPTTVKATELKERVVVKTLEGNMIGNPGDFIVKGVFGEVYPVKREIFIATYWKVK